MQKCCRNSFTAIPLREMAVKVRRHGKEKPMKLFRVLAFTLALSGTVYAGNIQNGVVQPPPPPPADTQTVAPETTIAPETTETSTVAQIIIVVVEVLGLI
jgi:hypothetical protein